MEGVDTTMKKIFCLCTAAISALALAAPCSVSAAVGDVAGEIYSTDILAVVNGEPMESYNIGGRTAVIAEDLDMKGYGFHHTYDDSTRTLYLQSGSNTWVGENSVERGRVGEIVGNIYETDIKVICNGQEIQGYNIGGRTAIVIEDLGAMDGTSVNEQYGYSKYLCNFTWDNDTRTVTLDALTNNYSYDKFLPYITYVCNDNVITASYSPDSMYAGGMDSWFSEDVYKNKLYLIEPLYLDLNGDKTEVGLMYAYTDLSSDDIDLRMSIDYDKLNSLTESLKTDDKPSYDEIMERFADTDKYRIISECETENYKCMFVDFKEESSDTNIHLISVNKNGGYVTIWTISSEYYTVFEIEKIGTDKVNVRYGPTAGPHGESVLINTELDLMNWYQY